MRSRLAFILLCLAVGLVAQSDRAIWNQAQKPFRIYGDTYYVGPHGLSAILIASPQGDVLVDGALPESAPLIAGNIRALGFRVRDIKLILNSHAHFDHAGGIAALQRLSGARVAASPWTAKVLRSGKVLRDDPQFGLLSQAPPAVPAVEIIRDGEVLRVGRLALTAHFTPGHTPGGTSWTWTSCEAGNCLHMVYADSLNSPSAPRFRYSGAPALLAGFQRSFAFLRTVPCDVLLTPHPDISGFWSHPPAQVNHDACRQLAATSEQALQQRLARER